MKEIKPSAPASVCESVPVSVSESQVVSWRPPSSSPPSCPASWHPVVQVRMSPRRRETDVPRPVSVVFSLRQNRRHQRTTVLSAIAKKTSNGNFLTPANVAIHRVNKPDQIYCWSNVQYDGNWVMLYSLLADMACPSNISCDRSVSLKCSQSECLSHDPVGQLMPVWLYCCALQNSSN